MAFWTVCVSLCLLFALNASACRSGWTHHGNRCFRVFNQAMIWKDAEMTCLDHGGNLASVHSLEENAFIKRMISNIKSEFWIGGYDAVSEGTWFWSDGSKMNVQLWYPGEPNNLGTTEHCIEMNTAGAKNWNDQECTDKLPFVCATSDLTCPC